MFERNIKFIRTMKSEDELLEKLADMERHKAILQDQVQYTSNNIVEWEQAVRNYNEQIDYIIFLKWVLNIEQD